ncbi:1-phosphofructokinase [Acetonema longum]|uniref:Tagatose-6-phosphate kinase n=1 Tax=Acetonema longum DSM 6540 TaxID=1009370 RepID=F7NGX9_9FIRM|nr:1-phosphofructokinase [Acetonema longum]EGO64710.1 1-phosphofructokinase [Acetonema longum DSM 6540]
MSDSGQQKIVTITLNPALDHTVHIPQFQAGALNRVEQQRIDPGGKGINVAKVARALGCPVTATGFLGQDNSKVFREYFQQQGIHDCFVEVAGAARMNIKIVDGLSGQVTEINFPGLASNEGDLARLTEVIRQLAGERQWFVFSGSLPPGVPDTVYHRFIPLLKQQGVKVMLDSSGPALREGIKAMPDVIKPNLDELRQLTGKSLIQEAEIQNAVDDLLAGGIRQVIVTLGSQGAIVADKSQMLRVWPPAVVAKSTVGAGDALVAGFVVGQTRGLSLADCARLGTAAATASVVQPGTQAGSLQEVDRLLAAVQISDAG